MISVFLCSSDRSPGNRFSATRKKRVFVCLAAQKLSKFSAVGTKQKASKDRRSQSQTVRVCHRFVVYFVCHIFEMGIRDREVVSSILTHCAVECGAGQAADTPMSLSRSSIMWDRGMLCSQKGKCRSDVGLANDHAFQTWCCFQFLSSKAQEKKDEPSA